MKVGYARVSTLDQSLNLQIDALKREGCDRIFTDEGISGSKRERPGLDEALTFIREGDTLVIWKLDRLGRSLSHLLEIIEGFKKRGVHFRSIQDSFDTATAAGKMIFSVMGAMAEYERNLTHERTMAGLASARARGRMGGRPYKLTEADIKIGVALAEKGEMTVGEICEQIGCKRNTYYRRIAPRLKKVEVPALELNQLDYVPPGVA